MFSKIAAALATVTLVSAQTWTDCNPLEKTCPSNPGFGKDGASCDFTRGACDVFHVMAGKPVTYDSRGALAAMDGAPQAPTLRSDKYLFFGRVEVELQAAGGKGIITSLVLQSDTRDEIDFETVGYDQTHIQSNYFAKGDDSDFTRGASHPVDNVFGAVHKYTFDWTPEKIEWIINGAVVRTLRRDSVGDAFPQSPMQVKLGAWVAGYEGGRPGTITWAGGIADFSQGPAVAIYKSIKIVDYAGGSSETTKDVKDYVYTDKSGSAKSIKVNLKDGTSTDGGSGGSSASASAPTSASTSTTASVSDSLSASTSASVSDSVSASTSRAVSASTSHSASASKTSSFQSVTSSATFATTLVSSSTKNSTASVTVSPSSALNGTTSSTNATASRTSVSSSTATAVPTSSAAGSGAAFGLAALFLSVLAI